MPFQKGNELWKLKIYKKHGMSHTRLYDCWKGMKSRCNRKRGICYHRYGGRGITYCKEWEKFEPFMEWALANGYSDDLTLDRIDNDGNYCPENCRWATQKQQAANKTHPNKSGYPWVRVHKKHDKKTGEEVQDGYVGFFKVNGKSKYCGYSKTAKGAYEKRQKYIEEHYADTL